MKPDLIYGLICAGPDLGKWWEVGQPIGVKPIREVRQEGESAEVARYEAYTATELFIGERGHVVHVVCYKPEGMDEDPCLLRPQMDEIAVDFTRQVVTEGRYLHPAPGPEN